MRENLLLGRSNLADKTAQNYQPGATRLEIYGGPNVKWELGGI